MAEGIRIVTVEEGFKSLAKEVKKCLKGGKVLLFAREGREGEDAEATLALEGYTVVRREVRDAFIMRRSFDREEIDFVAAAVGVGGLKETEAAKDYAAYGKVPTFLYPTDFTALSAFIEHTECTTAVQRVTVRSDCFTVVTDRSLYASGEGIRSGLGHLLARFTEGLDGAYADLILHKKDPAPSLAALTRAFEGWTEDRPLAERMLSAALSLASADRPAVKSATELAFLAARSVGGRYDDYLFPASYALLDLYKYYLSDFPLECALPPDRAETAARIGSACGLSASALLAKSARYADGYTERMRVTGEYREDFLQAIAAFPLAALCRAYRRAPTHPDEKAISSERLLELLSLTGEAVSGYALVKHVKLTGLLEPLLVSA